MHILLVDDEADNRLTMKTMLEVHGHYVELAENGSEAVKIATQHVPDVVLMDLGMPVMDGLTATRILHERAETVAVPIVCLSAYLSDSEWCARAYAAGCIACVTKPVHWHEFQALLADLGELKRGQQE
jgi:two-component system, cell cycle response regulator DivK